jgi:integral membrane protein
MNELALKKWFNIFCVAEFISCILLFCVAMPVKYGYDPETFLMFPIGMFHGVAFMGYILFAILVKKYYKWDDEEFVFILLFAFIPFATWFVHKKVKKQDLQEQKNKN